MNYDVKQNKQAELETMNCVCACVNGVYDDDNSKNEGASLSRASPCSNEQKQNEIALMTLFSSSYRLCNVLSFLVHVCR